MVWANCTGTPSSPCVVKHLVVLVQFADHAERELPPRSSYETQFNNENSESIQHYTSKRTLTVHLFWILMSPTGCTSVRQRNIQSLRIQWEYRRNHSLQRQESRPNSRNMERIDADSRRSKLWFQWVRQLRRRYLFKKLVSSTTMKTIVGLLLLSLVCLLRLWLKIELQLLPCSRFTRIRLPSW
jgi:hypothetical protein